MKLASGDTVVIAMRPTINIESAHAADALATVVVETNGMCDAVVDEPLIQDVEHLKKRAVRRDIVDGIGFEMPLGAGVLLSPNM